MKRLHATFATKIFKALATCFLVVFSLLHVSAKKYYSISHPTIISCEASENNLPQILSLYYDLKNALVNSDAATASAKADELLKAVNGVDPKSLSADEKKAFSSLQNKLASDAKHISEVKDLSQQRQHFITLSQNMYALAKTVKLSEEPVYQQYCPMKDAYWLSSETAIKNPYYGSSMLTCGSIKDTLK
jgi:hypothetical protein